MSFDTAFAARGDLAPYGSNGLLLFALEMRFQIDDIHTVAADALTDGSDDKKCDLIYVDPDEGNAVVAQGFVAADASRAAAPSNKASDLNTAAGWLLGRNLTDMPERIRPAATQLRDAIEDGKIRTLQFWYVHNLPESANVESEMRTVQATAVAGLRNLFLGREVPDVVVIEVGNAILTEWYQSLTNPILVQDAFEITIPGGYQIAAADWSAFVTAVPAQWLYEIYAAHRSDLFSANVRGYLGSRQVDANINNGIKTTVQDDPEHFWAFNNGLTILVHKFEVLAPDRIKVTGISIVNGAQTTGAVGSIPAEPADTAMVPARFVACVNTDTVKRIIRYNNSQNKVEAPDFRSNDTVQRRLRDEFSAIGSVTYLGGRRGGDDDRIRRPANLLPSDTAGQALAAFHGDPVIAYNEKSRIWISDTLYSRYFAERTSAKHIIFAFSLLRAVEARKKQLMASSASNSLTTSWGQQLAFLRNRGATFLLTGAIASCLEAVLNRPIPDSLRLSFGDRVTPPAAEKQWTPIVNATIPFVYQLEPAIQRGLNNAELVRQTVQHFRSHVEATREPNSAVYDAFSGLVHEE